LLDGISPVKQTEVFYIRNILHACHYTVLIMQKEYHVHSFDNGPVPNVVMNFCMILGQRKYAHSKLIDRKRNFQIKDHMHNSISL
jgi:hypothetical protein